MSQARTECTVKACRICLQTNCRMYKFDRYNLLAYYMEIMGTHATLPDNLPPYFCFECATSLHKAHRFKLKCHHGLSILKQLARNNSALTYKAVQKTDRKKNKLKTLDILDVNDRVQTIILKDSHYKNSLRKTLNSNKSQDSLNSEKILKHDVNVINLESEAEEIKIKEENEIEMQFVDENIDASEIHVKPELLSNNAVNCNGNDNIVLADIINQNSELEVSDDNDADFRISDVESNSDNESLAKIQVKIENINDYKGENIWTEDKPISKLKTKSKDRKDKSSKRQKKHKTEKDSLNNLDKPIKKRKRKNTALDQFGMKKSNPKFANRKIKTLDPKLWKQYCLTEEQAWVEFNELLNDFKYTAAEYKCTDCRMWFRRDDIMKRHMVLKHDETKGKLSCRFCRMRFKRDCVLRRHLRKHFTRFECQACDFKSSNESSVEFHQQMHSGHKKECQLCGEAFRHMSTYYTHLRTHRTNFICTLCGVSFVSEKGLYMHKKVKHCTQDATTVDSEEDNTDTYCVKCEIRFETRAAYNEHVFQSANHHLADKCDETTEIKDPGRKLKLGVAPTGKGKGPRKHTTCHQCGQEFETLTACMKHHKKEHPRTSFYPDTERHICEICGASLSPNSIAAHLNTHQPQVLFTCDTCGRSFNTRVSLSRHILTHTGERPYPCKACDKRFGQRCTMVAHYRAIHLKMPYPKRNRRKKPPSEVESPRPSPRPAPGPGPGPGHEGVGYSRGLMALAPRFSHA